MRTHSRTPTNHLHSTNSDRSSATTNVGWSDYHAVTAESGQPNSTMLSLGIKPSFQISPTRHCRQNREMRKRIMCIDGMSVADRAVYNLYPSPAKWPEFYAWAKVAFGLVDDSWDGAGRKDPINGNLPYGKMLTSIYLLGYALRDEYIPQWHARQDYEDAARYHDSNYHGPFYLWFENSNASEALASTGRFLARDRTAMRCLLFDRGGASDDPVNRASVMVHEAWHHWQYKYNWDTTHQTGGAVAPGSQGDWYYQHRSGLFDFGTLWTFNANANPIRFHSPYQVAIEYDGDIAEYSFSWVPTVVRQQARLYGNTRLANQCKNRVYYRIGDPRPF
jgi:hypothetical protein